MEIRTYKPGDADGITTLFNLAFSQHGIYLERTAQSWLWRYDRHPNFDPGLVFLAIEGNEIVGSVILTPLEYRFGGVTLAGATIDDFATHPSRQGKGIAKKLMCAAVDSSRARGMDILTSYVGPGSVSAKIHLSSGFEIVSQVLVWTRIIRLDKILFDNFHDVVRMLWSYLFSKKEVDGQEWKKAPKSSFNRIKMPSGKIIESWEKSIRENPVPDLEKIADFVQRQRTLRPGSHPVAVRDLNWRLTERPKDMKSVLLISEFDGEIKGVLSAHSHPHRFTKSGREFIIGGSGIFEVDANLPWDQRAAISLGMIRRILKKAGELEIKVLNIPCMIDDAFSPSVLKSLGFFNMGAADFLINNLKNRDLPPVKGPFWFDSESLFGEP